MSLPYATLVNTCNAEVLAKQSNDKPHYTPSKALKKAFKLLRRFFKPITSGKAIIIAEKQVTAPQTWELTEKQTVHSNANLFNASSTLSAEECENYLNELTELEALSIQQDVRC